MRSIGSVFLTLMWVADMIIASGFWSTLFAVFMPLWAWYLTVERVLVHFGMLAA